MVMKLSMWLPGGPAFQCEDPAVRAPGCSGTSKDCCGWSSPVMRSEAMKGPGGHWKGPAFSLIKWEAMG